MKSKLYYCKKCIQMTNHGYRDDLKEMSFMVCRKCGNVIKNDEFANAIKLDEEESVE